MKTTKMKMRKSLDKGTANIQKMRAFSFSQGAVVAEFIVITSLVLLPLTIGMMYLGKTVENKQKMEMAARYSGWERTVWYQKRPDSLSDVDKGKKINTVKSEEQIAHEIENRIFSIKDTPIYIAQNTKEVNEIVDPMTESIWMSDQLKPESIYNIEKDKFINTTLAQKDKAYGVSVGALGFVFDLLSSVSSLDLNLSGAYTSEVNMSLKKPKFLDEVLKEDIVFTKNHTILADGWNAAGPAHVTNMVEGTVLLKLLDFGALDTVRKILAIVPISKELGPNYLEFAHVEVEAVPSVRLEKYKKK